MIDSVDDSFTSYNDKENTDTFTENVTGTYEGIGATISMDQDDNIYFVSIFENSPAEKAGLKEKDIIIKALP